MKKYYLIEQVYQPNRAKKRSTQPIRLALLAANRNLNSPAVQIRELKEAHKSEEYVDRGYWYRTVLRSYNKKTGQPEDAVRRDIRLVAPMLSSMNVMKVSIL